MKNCPVCSTPAQHGEKFCGVCGTLFESFASSPSRTEPVTPGSHTATGKAEKATIPSTATDKVSVVGRRGRIAIIGLPALQFLFSVILLGLILYNATAVVDAPDNEIVDKEVREQLENKKAVLGGLHFQLVIITMAATTGVLLAQLRHTFYKGTIAPSLLALIILAFILTGAYLQDPPEVETKGAVIYLDQYQITIAFTAVLLLTLISYLVFLYTLTDKQTQPGAVGSISLLVMAGLIVAATIFHNYFIGPWAASGKNVAINLQPIDLAIILIANLILIIGLAHYLLRAVGIADYVEARYFGFIIFGLGMQYLTLILNVARNGADLVMGFADLVAIFMSAVLIVIGLSLFYLKRRTSRSFEASGYFGLLVAGILAMVLFLVIPALLSERDMDLTEKSQWPTLAMSIIMALGGLYLLLQYARRELGPWKDMNMPQTTEGTPSAEPPAEDGVSLDEAFDKILSEFPDSTIDMGSGAEQPGPSGLDWDGVKNFMDDQGEPEEAAADAPELEEAGEVRAPTKVNYKVQFPKITEVFSTRPDTVNQIVTHLKSGKNVMLYGEPGTGKTKLSTLLLSQICGFTSNAKDRQVPNFTIVTANAEWSNFEVIGGIAPDDKGGYFFKDGYVAEAAKRCDNSIRELGRPHYLVIDEFNRANIDEAFGKLFTVFEYRDKQALLTGKENKGKPFMMPPEFRIIGTMNTKDKNTLFNVGHALMRRFSFVEIPLPDKAEEYKRMPEFVFDHMEKLGHAPDKTTEADKTDWFAKEKFDFYDEDGELYQAYVKLMGFMEEEEEPGRDEEVPRGVRTYRKIGPAALIDSMVTIVNARGQYELEKALEDVIHANVMPSMEGMEKHELRCIRLKAVETLGPHSSVTQTLEKMIESPSLSMFG